MKYPELVRWTKSICMRHELALGGLVLFIPNMCPKVKAWQCCSI
jgi:hypothetical protein